MKKEMAMLPNGNYEPIICVIQHCCHSKDYVFKCVKYSREMDKLYLIIEDGDPYENGYAKTLQVNFCPFCGYQNKTKDLQEM